MKIVMSVCTRTCCHENKSLVTCTVTLWRGRGWRERIASEYVPEYAKWASAFFDFCGFFFACLLLVLLFISRSEVTSTCAFSIFFLSRRALPANPPTVILRYIYVSGAERRLALTCVGEVVAPMESSTWQPSRQRWYVFKILSSNKTCFCYLQGHAGLGFWGWGWVCLQWPPGGPRDCTGSWLWFTRKVKPHNVTSFIEKKGSGG